MVIGQCLQIEFPEEEGTGGVATTAAAAVSPDKGGSSSRSAAQQGANGDKAGSSADDGGGSSGSSKVVMVPFACHINHSPWPHCVRYGRLNPRTRTLDYPAFRPCKEGQQVGCGSWSWLWCWGKGCLPASLAVGGEKGEGAHHSGGSLPPSAAAHNPLQHLTAYGPAVL